MKKVKILFIISTLERSGPVNVIFNIIKFADRIEPVILTFSKSHLSRKRDFEALGARVVEFNKSRLSWMLSFVDDILNQIRLESPDVIHSHSLRADIFSFKRLKGYLRTATIHADLKMNYTDTYNSLIATWFEKQQIDSIAGLERAVACADNVKDIYKGRIPGLRSIQNGVDQTLFSTDADKAGIRKQLHLPVSGSLFISAGSLTERKDPERIIKEFLQVRRRDDYLIFVGQGKLEPELKSRYSHEPAIVFKGFVSDPEKYLMASDFFISASKSEGLPNTVMEAMACGLPVCLSDIPAHREIMDIDSGAGFLFAAAEGGLAECITKIRSRKYDELQRASINIIDSRLNARYMAAKYQDLYFEMIKDKLPNATPPNEI